ncbi:phosphotransferase [Glaciibacter superstes]|uniref:phosphotransferase n=1 Tax=Glaciibacter superstes TaxID=501023 RepID=UPI00041F1C47|nr:phosphotransferase [Glaciibacter superstes]
MGREEIPLDAELVRGLLSRQFPKWAQLPLEFVARGTVNAMFRLGDNMLVRLPFIAGGGEGIDLEAAWLPRLAGRLNAPIPELLGVGEPDEAYPSSWLVVSWLPGDPAVPGSTQNPDALARDLAGFLLSLRDVDTTDAQPGYRTGPLVELDASVRECAEQVHDLVDVA